MTYYQVSAALNNHENKRLNDLAREAGTTRAEVVREFIRFGSVEVVMQGGYQYIGRRKLNDGTVHEYFRPWIV